MSAEGHRRKYRCDDCKHEEMEHFLTRNRVRPPRCPRCGSYFYEIRLKAQRDDAASLLDARRIISDADRPQHFRPA